LVTAKTTATARKTPTANGHCHVIMKTSFLKYSPKEEERRRQEPPLTKST